MSLIEKTPLAAIGVQSYCPCTPIHRAKAMTTQIIKEKDNLPATEEMLLSEMIVPSIRTASELNGRLTCLDNIYNGEA